jgi:hypothetical protein
MPPGLLVQHLDVEQVLRSAGGLLVRHEIVPFDHWRGSGSDHHEFSAGREECGQHLDEIRVHRRALL